MAMYYYANQLYQLSYALPFYKRLGGTIIVNSISKYFKFHNQLKGMAAFNENTLLNTPNIIIRKNGNMQDLEGIILSFSNLWIERDPAKCKIIFHEHGASDKRIGSNLKTKPLEKLKNFDYIFLMSPKNQIKIKALAESFDETNLADIEDKFVKIHNLRFAEYLEQSVNKQSILNNIGIKDSSRKTVLYAPTWRFGSGTLRKYFHQFAREITKEYNLIIRPHFHDAKLIPQYKLWAFTHNINNIYFSNPANLKKHDTFTDFIASDILLSDTSAVLYEYLITENPIIIIHPNYGRQIEMPDNLNIMKNSVIFNKQDNISSLIIQALEEKKYSIKYHKMYTDCFYTPNENDVVDAIDFINKLNNNI